VKQLSALSHQLSVGDSFASTLGSLAFPAGLPYVVFRKFLSQEGKNHV
jgi:hypothetical protein